MAGFEDYARNTRAIERAIEQKGVALGVDWSDEQQVRALAREALAHAPADGTSVAAHDHKRMARMELFGLIGLMLQTMQESASVGIESHGGAVWKSLARALWAEKGLRDQT
jgi:hypothetical protein